MLSIFIKYWKLVIAFHLPMKLHLCLATVKIRHKQYEKLFKIVRINQDYNKTVLH